jgi:hypothetical protein
MRKRERMESNDPTPKEITAEQLLGQRAEEARRALPADSLRLAISASAVTVLVLLVIVVFGLRHWRLAHGE